MPLLLVNDSIIPVCWIRPVNIVEENQILGKPTEPAPVGGRAAACLRLLVREPQYRKARTCPRDTTFTAGIRMDP